MTPSEHLIAFGAMAVAIVEIIVIGTLAAADILHVGRRSRARDTSAPSQRTGLHSAAPSGDPVKELTASGAGHWRPDQ